MKNTKTEFRENENAQPFNFQEAFLASNELSELEIKRCFQIKNGALSDDQKLENITEFKKKVRKIFKEDQFNSIFREYFYIDGSIKINETDIEELKNSFVEIDSDGHIKSTDTDTFFNDYLINILDNFTYLKGDNLIFRNNKFYFLFESLEINIKNGTSSINDYEIMDIDIHGFYTDFLEHYNLIDQNLLIFSTHILNKAGSDLLKNSGDFCNKINSLLSEDKLLKYENTIKKTNPTNSSFDQLQREQGKDCIAGLKLFRTIINEFHSNPTKHLFDHIIEFISRETNLIELAKITLSIDINSIFNTYYKVNIPKSMNKVMLGLLDAKVNMLAFIQNATQIISNNNFLNPDYIGNLILDQSSVRSIQKTCPREFKAFKILQNEIREKKQSNLILGILDNYIGYFIDILGGKNNITYTKIVGDIPKNLQELLHGKTAMMRNELEDSITLLQSFFGLLDTYITVSEYKKIPNSHEQFRLATIKKKALEKIIRLYREENDPLIMIKTAQNALNSIIQKGYKEDDVLHIMGVNYGGTLVGIYAKHIFMNTINRGRVLANTGNIIYSLYDVKNVNSFLGLTDYPFAKLMQDDSIDISTKEKIKHKNWLLIFDDNSNSGETLYNLKKGALESGIYGKVDTFVCRSNYKIEKYKKELTHDEKLNYIIHSAIPTRQTKRNPETQRYKELLGTIVGIRIHKILFPNEK